MAEERTEEATLQQREQARRLGRVARSDALTRAVVLGVTTTLFWGTGVATAARLAGFTTWSIDAAFGHVSPILAARMACDVVVEISAPFLTVAALSALIIALVQVRPLFTLETLGSPVRLRSPGLDGLREIGFDLLSVLGLALVVLPLAREGFQVVLRLPHGTLPGALAALQPFVAKLAIRTMLALLALGLFDFWRKRAAWLRSLRLSRAEQREEARRSEGNPEVRTRRRQAQQPRG